MALDVTASIDAIGFGKFQWLLLVYTGLAWVADACETMLLSFLGPAIECVVVVEVVDFPCSLTEVPAGKKWHGSEWGVWKWGQDPDSVPLCLGGRRLFATSLARTQEAFSHAQW